MTLVDLPFDVDPAAVDVADPRGLRPRVTDQEDLRSALDALTSFYVARPEELHPTLLAAGPVDGNPGASAVLVGVTFPSGATAASLVTVQGRSVEDRWGSIDIARADVAPAGAGLLDRVFAVSGPNSLTVSGPASGVLADVFGPNGLLLAQIPLTTGAGSAAVSGALPGTTVRFLDAAGSVVAESPLTGISR
jgi:hypothetical protein